MGDDWKYWLHFLHIIVLFSRDFVYSNLEKSSCSSLFAISQNFCDATDIFCFERFSVPQSLQPHPDKCESGVCLNDLLWKLQYTFDDINRQRFKIEIPPLTSHQSARLASNSIRPNSTRRRAKSI